MDLEFRKRLFKKVLRASRAAIKPRWHLEQALECEQRNNWYTATVHRAWVMKADTTRATRFDRLHAAHTKLVAEFESTGRNVAPLLKPGVMEMLALPRGIVRNPVNSTLGETVKIVSASSFGSPWI